MHGTPDAQYPGPPEAPLSKPMGAVEQHTCPIAPQELPGAPGVCALQPLVPELELHPEDESQERHAQPSQPP